jgi:DNA-binding response OmpR family regulator
LGLLASRNRNRVTAVPTAAVLAVLYVEDEPLIRELMAAVLEDAGFELLIVADGAAAIAALDGHGPPFCIVITDVNLGDGPDGWDVARRARVLNHAMPVIYVTGGPTHEWKSKGVANSVMIKKPFSAPQIIRAIRSLLAADDTAQQDC